MLNELVGAVYVLLGTFGLLENSLTAYLLGSDGELRHPTYYYMVNLCICDAVEATTAGIYTGFGLIWPPLLHSAARRTASFLTLLSWYVGCTLMVLCAVSRYVQLAHAHLIPIYLTRRNTVLSAVGPTALVAGFYSCLLYARPLAFDFSSSSFTWEFAVDHRIGYALFVANAAITIFYALLLVCFNLMSYLCLRHMRAYVRGTETMKSHRREVKLFVQIAVTSSVYVAVVVYYNVAALVNVGSAFQIITHLLWLLHHIQNPIMYFALNSRLRRGARKLIRLDDSTMQSYAV